MAAHRPHVLSLRDENIPADFLIVRKDEAVAFALLIGADDLVVGPLQNLYNRPLGPPFSSGLLDDDLDRIAV